MIRRSSFFVFFAVVAACAGSDAEDAGDGSVQCTPELGTSPSGCPESSAAEAAFANVKSTCGVVDAELDATDPASPTLTDAGKAKICTTCDCRKAVYAYRTQYANCTSEDQANAALAKNLYEVASTCP
ncbi:MAG: hypothetical protein KIT84_03870 [Labilithrix sp.]|nr:hypothetical protein [Labilithrix sp.]MCW5810122.1 hypothetical protein [Labilithrix sp.]